MEPPSLVLPPERFTPAAHQSCREETEMWYQFIQGVLYLKLFSYTFLVQQMHTQKKDQTVYKIIPPNSVAPLFTVIPNSPLSWPQTEQSMGLVLIFCLRPKKVCENFPPIFIEAWGGPVHMKEGSHSMDVISRYTVYPISNFALEIEALCTTLNWIN